MNLTSANFCFSMKLNILNIKNKKYLEKNEKFKIKVFKN